MFSFLRKFKPFDFLPPPTTEQKEQEEREAYLKYILTFRRPQDYEERIAKDLFLLSEYDWVDEDSEANHISGHMDKRFVRLNKLYFDSYVREVQTGKPNSYVTYLNDEDVMTGNFPTNLSALVKQVKMMWIVDDSPLVEKLYHEIVTPKVMNYFGMKTVYNEMLVDDGNYYIFSLDFIKPEHFYYRSNALVMPNEKGEKQDSEMLIGYKLSDSVSSISDKLDILQQAVCEDFGIKKKHSLNKQTIQEEFVKLMLVRTLLLGDSDFCGRNYGFVYDAANHQIVSAPGHDYEFCFAKLARSFPYAKENIDYMLQHYPHVVKEFMDRLMEFISINPETQKPYYQDIIENNVGNVELAKQMCGVVRVNSEYLIFNCLDKVRNFQSNQPQ